MTIRSVDMQVLVQRVGDVSKIQHAQQVQNNYKQQENAQQIMQQTTTVSKSVDQSREAESKRVREEKEKEKKRNPRKGQPEKDDDKRADSEVTNNGIDIIV